MQRRARRTVTMEREQLEVVAIVTGFILLVATFLILKSRGERKRREWFAALAANFQQSVESISEFHARFPIDLAGRTVDVADRHVRSGESGGSMKLVVSVPLRGVGDIFSLQFRPRRVPMLSGSDDELRTLVTGYQPREGWVDEEVRRSLVAFYALDHPRAYLDVDGGKLVYRCPKQLDAGELRELVQRQVRVAAELERVL
jgi:hypothetical protein